MIIVHSLLQNISQEMLELAKSKISSVPTYLVMDHRSLRVTLKIHRKCLLKQNYLSVREIKFFYGFYVCHFFSLKSRLLYQKQTKNRGD